MTLLSKSIMNFCVFASLFLAALARGAPSVHRNSLKTRQSSDKLVFCHFMMGVIADRTGPSDYDNDMISAKNAGIDAFALNIGTDPFTDQQLEWAYESARKNGMNVFLSFDFNWYTVSQAAMVGNMTKTYGSKPAQLKVGGKVFVSTFAGDGLDVNAVRSSAAGMDLFVAPNFRPENAGPADALLNWMAWPNNGKNKAPDASNNITVEAGDKTYQNALGTKPYIAPVSAWFSTHYGLEVSYSKNWVFPTDLLWYERWQSILSMNSKPQFLEILTWNDYGESHYIGPLSSPHVDDGNSKWTNDMPHDGWLTMARPYIAAFKASAPKVDPYIKSDQLIYWYRPVSKTVSCDSTDTCSQPWPSPSPNPNYFVGKPNGYSTVADSVFVVALLTSPGTLTVTSGSNSQSFPAVAGPNAFSVPMGTGKQSFTLIRNGVSVLKGDSLKDISDSCICGIYNFNAYVGTLPPSPSDPLQPDGLKSFTNSLKATCVATPSLGTAPAAQPTAASPTVVAVSSSAAASIASSSAVSPSLPPPSPSSVAIPQSQPTNPPPSPSPPPTPTPTSSPTSSPATAQQNGSKTMTAQGQLGPQNCLPKGYTWAGPAGSDPPAPCDG